VRLPKSDLGGEDAEVEPLGQAHLLEVTVQEPARVEGVRDEPEPEPEPAQPLQQRMRVRREHARRLPRAVLGLEEGVELLLVHLDLEVMEKPTHELRVLDLLDRPGRPEERLVLFAEVLRQLGLLVLPDRGEPRAVTGRDELGGVHELHQRVAPVEQNRLQHER
jgi:hypothetical protein